MVVQPSPGFTNEETQESMLDDESVKAWLAQRNPDLINQLFPGTIEEG
jgi:hypothetical protein